LWKNLWQSESVQEAGGHFSGATYPMNLSGVTGLALPRGGRGVTSEKSVPSLADGGILYGETGLLTK
jgi:hypothetical protein